MSHGLEAAVAAYSKVQRAERAFAKANHELNQTFIHLEEKDLDEYYRRTEALSEYQETTHRTYP